MSFDILYFLNAWSFGIIFFFSISNYFGCAIFYCYFCYCISHPYPHLVKLKCLLLHSVGLHHVLLLHLMVGVCMEYPSILVIITPKASSYFASKAILILCWLVQNHLPDVDLCRQASSCSSISSRTSILCISFFFYFDFKNIN